MFGIGFVEIIVIAVAGLLFIGPKRLPKVARQFGRMFVQMRRMTNDVRHTIDDAINQAENDLLKEEREKLRDAIDTEHAKLKDAVSLEPENSESQ